VRAHLLFISTRTGHCQTLRDIDAHPSEYAAVVWHNLTKGVITFITCEGNVVAANSARSAALGEMLYKREIAEMLARPVPRRKQPVARQKKRRPGRPMVNAAFPARKR
jgi:hypothetical protein